MKRYVAVFFLFALMVLTGCSIRLSSSKVRDGGIFRTNDFGERWEQKVFVRQEKNRLVTISDVDVSKIYISPFNPQEIILTTAANGIFATVNGGDDWHPTTLTTGNYPTFAYDPVNQALVYTANGRNIYKSADSGVTWEIIYTDSRGEIITSVVVDRYDPSRIYAGTNGGTILKSINYGNDWSVKYNAKEAIRTILFRSDDTRILYLVTAAKGIERSVDGGETWSSLLKNVATFPGANVVNQLITTPNNSKTLLAATNYGILKSTDGGDTWESITTLVPPNTLPIRTVGIDAINDQILYFTVNNLFHKSIDGGKTWRTIETIPTARILNTMITHPTISGLVYLGTLKPKK